MPTPEHRHSDLDEIAHLYFSDEGCEGPGAGGPVVCVSSWRRARLSFDDLAATLSSWGVPATVLGHSPEGEGPAVQEGGVVLWPVPVETLRQWPGAPIGYFVAISCADREALVAGYELARSVAEQAPTGIWLWAANRRRLNRALEGIRALWNEHGAAGLPSLSGACALVHESSAKSILRVCGLSDVVPPARSMPPRDPRPAPPTGAAVSVIHVDPDVAGVVTLLHANTPGTTLCRFVRELRADARIEAEGRDRSIHIAGLPTAALITTDRLTTLHIGDQAMLLTATTLPDACRWLARLAAGSARPAQPRPLWNPLPGAELAAVAALARDLAAP